MKNYNAFIEKMREDQKKEDMNQYKNEVTKVAVKQLVAEQKEK